MQDQLILTNGLYTTQKRLDKYKELLKIAPKHDSPEFIPFLHAHNVVVTEHWKYIIIENIKYHGVNNQKVYTAFLKEESDENITYLIKILLWIYGPTNEIRIHAPKDRTVDIFHCQVIKK